MRRKEASHIIRYIMILFAFNTGILYNMVVTKSTRNPFLLKMDPFKKMRYKNLLDKNGLICSNIRVNTVTIIQEAKANISLHRCKVWPETIFCTQFVYSTKVKTPVGLYGCAGGSGLSFSLSCVN